MRVFVLGATGFTGSRVTPRLLARGCEVTCLVRPTSDRGSLPAGVRVVEGDLGDVDALAVAMRGHDMLVCVASIGFGHGPGIVRAAKTARVRRAVFVSTTAIFTTLDAKTKSVRAAAEEVIRESGIDWTIVRPTMIYGSAGDRNMIRLIRHVRRWPIMFVVGSGDYLQQPIHVDDVASAVVAAAFSESAKNRAYNIAGAAPLTFNQVIDVVASCLGKRVRKIHVPAKPVIGALRWLERHKLRLPIHSEQLLRLEEHKAFSYEEAAADFAFSPRSFADGIGEEIRATSPRRATS